MSISRSVLGLVAGVWLAAMAALPAAAGPFEDAFRSEIYAGRIDAATELARAELAKGPDTGTAQAAIGVGEFLGTVQGLIQGFHRYGLYNGERGFSASMLTGMPFLRLPVPSNPNPEPVTYEKLRGVLRDFSDSLAVAEATLGKVGEQVVVLELDLMKIRLDLDGDGVSRRGESLMAIFGVVAGATQPQSADGTVIVDFDSSDAVWLRAYTHLLMGMTDFLLAYDWEAAYNASFEGMFPRSFTPKTPLNEVLRTAGARMAELDTRKNSLM